MSPMFTVLLVPFVAAMFLAINMGGSGTAPSFAAAYGAGIVRKDMIPGLFGLFVFLGAIIAGKKVVLTIGGDILPSTHMTLVRTTIILVSVGLSLLMANLLRVPQSTTQATVFALSGTALHLQVMQTRKLLTEIVPTWLILPVVSFVLAFLVGRCLYHPARRKWPEMRNVAGRLPAINWLVIAAACYVAFAIGSNNVANAAGPIASLVMNELGVGRDDGGFLLILIMATLVAAPCFAIGSSIFGGRVVETTGKDILKFGPVGASIISLITASLLLVVSATRGIPTSLVQMNTGAIIGLGVSELGWRRMFSETPLLKLVRVWFVAPLVAMALSWTLTVLAEKIDLL